MHPAEKMTHLEDLKPNGAVRGILPDQVLTVVSVQWFGSEALELTYTYKGRPDVLPTNYFTGVTNRIRLAHLFDPFSPFPLPSSNRYPTRSWRFTNRCWAGKLCASHLPMILAPAKRS